MPRDTSDKRKRQYQEINEYRDLLQAPNRFESECDYRCGR